MTWQPLSAPVRVGVLLITSLLTQARSRMLASHALVTLSQPLQVRVVREDLRQSNRLEPVITTTWVPGWASLGIFLEMARRRCAEALGSPIKARFTLHTPTRARTLRSIRSIQPLTSSWVTLV